MDPMHLEKLFMEWWCLSYTVPPNPHARMTHLSWGDFLLRRVEEMRFEMEDGE